MLDHIHIEDVLFLDIETVSQRAKFEDLDDDSARLWENKAKSLCKDDDTPAEVYERAGIYAEFGKIVCISVGFAYTQSNGQLAFRTKSCFGDDEVVLLNEFCDVVSKFSLRRNMQLCAHNGREFDFPYISRRMLINGISLPTVFDIAGKKPWEVAFIDTMELWRFGDYKNYTSLKLLTHIFNIPSPKDDIDGSQVGSVYWEEKNLLRIVRYCEKDVVAIAQLLMCYKGLSLIKEEDISSSTPQLINHTHQ